MLASAAGCGTDETDRGTPSPTRSTSSSSAPPSAPTTAPTTTTTKSTPPATATPAPTPSLTPPAKSTSFPSIPADQPAPADAIDLTGADLAQFINTKGDITCLFDDFEGVQVRCDVLGAHWPVDRPDNCQEAYGDSVTMGAAVVLTCHGDTIFSPDVDTVVAPTKSVRFHDFTCTVAADSVSCRNGKDARFTVSPATWSRG